MQLKQEREVPKEVMFKLSDATQDPIKKNRYWFDFPSQWADQSTKDPIIGIRDMYLTKGEALISFKLTLKIKEDVENESPITWLQRSRNIVFPLYTEDTIRTLANEVTLQYKTILIEEDADAQTKRLDIQSIDYEWDDIFVASYNYNYDTQQMLFKFGLGVPGNGYPVTVTDTLEQTHDCYFYISITPINRATKALFGTDKPIEQDIKSSATSVIKIPIWSRDNCYILSSLAEDDKNNFLGHTREASYTPIKYYRLTNGSKKFWIELYESRGHNIPVTIPIGKVINRGYDSTQEESNNNQKYIESTLQDDLFIEAVVCFSSSGMI